MARAILILYFLLFPFGQLLRIEIELFGVLLTVQPIDVIALLSIPFVLLKELTPHPLRKPFIFFWCICILSLLISLTRYPASEVLRGSFYLLRFISYYFFFELLIHVIQIKLVTKEKVISILLTSLVVTSAIGWIQYFYLSDLRFLKAYNWDDHLYRLTGGFLDPGFMGILMVFGFFIATYLYFKQKEKVYLLLSFSFLLTTLLTYARAAYVALFTGLFIFVWMTKKFGYLLITCVVVIGILTALPKREGEGVKLGRTHSMYERLGNYEETLEIFSQHPVFGVGFNTICSERLRVYGGKGFKSHACSGSDSSMLLILATVGVTGFFAFVTIIFTLWKQTHGSILFCACSISLLTHSIFVNSFFYPWVLGVIAVLLATSIMESTKQ